MSVCYFDKKDKKYKCEYVIKDDCIEVTVDYNIEDELEDENGLVLQGLETNYKTRDILIIDYNNKKSILLKDASYYRFTEVFGTPDEVTQTVFISYTYFMHSDYNKLNELPDTPKVKSIKIYSKTINDLFGNPSLTKRTDDNEIVFALSKDRIKNELEVITGNIKTISISEEWKSSANISHILVDFRGYIEIELKRRINYDQVNQYINELCVFMQLYVPGCFAVDDIAVKVDDDFYYLYVHCLKFKNKRKSIVKSVDVDLKSFLERCYSNIRYIKSKSEIRNIPYIINKSTRVEENFLMFYRFIECYYKKRGIKNSFISYGIKNDVGVKSIE